MVGIIPYLLLKLIEETAGPQALDEVKSRAGIPADADYQLNAIYPDDEWRRLFSETCNVLQITQERAEQVYADYFCRDAQQRWPTWFSMSSDARAFLRRQPAIHNTFATGLLDPIDRQAVIDKFRVEDRGPDLVVFYHSDNRLCGLYKALAGEIIRHYGESAEISERCCQKNGDKECEIHVRWT